MPRACVLPAFPSALLAAALVAGCALPGTGAGANAAEARATSSALGATGETPESVAPASEAPTFDPPSTSAGTAAPSDAPTGVAPPSAAASAEPAPHAEPAPSAEPAPGVEDGPFAMNLYREGDFVPQYTFEWCVGASLQMMRNLTDAKVTRSRSTQQAWWELARDLSSSPFGGANPRGWTAALNELGHGPYELVSIPDYDDALRTAASAIRETKRPVGLVMWRGRHAWVMSGFEADADPRAGDDFRVTGIRVMDPLYPHGSSVWGSSPAPNSLLTPARLGKQFVIRDSRRVNLGVPPGYLLILPVEG